MHASPTKQRQRNLNSARTRWYELDSIFEASDYTGPIGYTSGGDIISTQINLYKFNYVNEGGKYYLKATEVDAGVGKYLTNKAGTVTLEATASPDAVIEFFDPNGANQAEVAEL